jgi:hypothetical protein
MQSAVRKQIAECDGKFHGPVKFSQKNAAITYTRRPTDVKARPAPSGALRMPSAKILAFASYSTTPPPVIPLGKVGLNAVWLSAGNVNERLES